MARVGRLLGGVVLLAGTALLAACTPAPQPVDAETIATVRQDPDAPSWWPIPPEYERCPDVIEPGRYLPRDAVDCLLGGGDEGRELAVVERSQRNPQYARVVFLRQPPGDQALTVVGVGPDEEGGEPEWGRNPCTSRGVAPDIGCFLPDSEYTLNLLQFDESGPAALVDRERLPRCSTVDLRPERPLTLDVLPCLRDAGDAGAEVPVYWTTASGAPSISWFRVGPGIDGVEVFVDRSATTGDYGHLLCPELPEQVDPQGCRDLGAITFEEG